MGFLRRLLGGDKRTRVVDLADKGLDVISETVTDKDLANKLKYELLTKRAEYLLSGKGAGITKITISALVALLVCIGCYVFLVSPEKIKMYKDLALTVTPLLGILIGSYASATTLQKRKNGR